MIVGSWKQANALIDPFRSVYVFAKWPCNRLYVKVNLTNHPGSMPSLSFTAILKRCWQPM
jgi:hypothetical protein